VDPKSVTRKHLAAVKCKAWGKLNAHISSHTLFPHLPASTSMITFQTHLSYKSRTSCLRKTLLPKYFSTSQRNSCRLITPTNRFLTRSRCCSIEQSIVHEHHRRRTSTLHLKMQRSEHEWSGLCQKVKSLVPKELGNEAWYLIIVSSHGDRHGMPEHTF
jgi:hypothetical protein